MKPTQPCESAERIWATYASKSPPPDSTTQRCALRDAPELLDAFAGDVAVGLTNLIYVLDPARIVLGGGLVEIGAAMLARELLG